MQRRSLPKTPRYRNLLSCIYRITLGFTSLLTASPHWCIAHTSGPAVRTRSPRGSKAILATCLLLQEAGSKKTNGSNFPEGSYSLEQLADQRLPHLSVSRGERHLFLLLTACTPPANKQHAVLRRGDPCPTHKQPALSSSRALSLCTKLLPLLERPPYPGFGALGKAGHDVDTETTPSLEKGVRVTGPFAVHI